MLKNVKITNAYGDSLTFKTGHNDFGLLSMGDLGSISITNARRKGYLQRGETVVQKSYDARNLTLTLMVSGKTRTSFYNRMRQVSRLFEVEYTESNDLTPFTIEIETIQGKKMAQAYVDMSPSFRMDADNYDERFQRFMVNFVMPTPVFMDLVGTEILAESQIDAFEFPVEIEDTFIFADILEGGFNIVNTGEVSMPLRIRFVGESTNPVVGNVTYGEFLKLNTTIADGDEVIIDTSYENPQVMLISGGVATSGFQFIDSEQSALNMMLRRGVNEFVYTSDDATRSSAIIEYRRGWLSVYGRGEVLS